MLTQVRTLQLACMLICERSTIVFTFPITFNSELLRSRLVCVVKEADTKTHCPMRSTPQQNENCNLFIFCMSEASMCKKALAQQTADRLCTAASCPCLGKQPAA